MHLEVIYTIKRGNKKQLETTMHYTFVCFHVAISFHTVSDFNATEIVTEIAAANTRWEEGIEIFDDDINEAQEEFEVFLMVEGNFTVTYTIQTTVCRIPENDRKLLRKFAMYTAWECLIRFHIEFASVW